MFDDLSDRLRDVLGRLTGRGRVTEADVDAAMREVRLALLEADVNYKVVKDFVARVRERAIGAEVLESLNAGQQVIKIVHEELTAILGAGDQTFHLNGSPAIVIMLVGLQGSGKTTTAAKLARLRDQAGPAADARRGRPVPTRRGRPAADAGQGSSTCPVYRAPDGHGGARHRHGRARRGSPSRPRRA